MQGLGTDEDTLIEILASRSNKEIREINRVYREGQVQYLSSQSDSVMIYGMSDPGRFHYEADRYAMWRELGYRVYSGGIVRV